VVTKTRLRKKHSHPKIARDLLIIVVSVILALFLVKGGAIEYFISLIQGQVFLGSFIAGIFFTSLFTIAPASIALAKISLTASPLLVAFWGALGAMIGDLLLFLFIRDSLAEDLLELIKNPEYKRIRGVFKLRLFRWFIPLLGALVIISPLPDELGLALMGFSKVKTKVMLPLTFALNFLGILLIFAIANAI
jgi:hypothetical protein